MLFRFLLQNYLTPLNNKTPTKITILDPHPPPKNFPSIFIPLPPFKLERACIPCINPLEPIVHCNIIYI